MISSIPGILPCKNFWEIAWRILGHLLLSCHQTRGTIELIDHTEFITQDGQFQLLFKNPSPWTSICFPLNFLFHCQLCVLIYKSKRQSLEQKHSKSYSQKEFLAVFLFRSSHSCFMVLTEGICPNEEIYSSMRIELK